MEAGARDSHDPLRIGRRRPWLWRIAAASLAVAVLLWGLWVFSTLPPRTVVMTTGSEGGAYHEYGKRYREILARSGVELKLLPSEGGIENLRRLSDPRSGVDAGFLQGGVTTGREPKDLVSLGTVAYEPLWFFSRGGHPGRRLEGLRGKRISIGPEGSGTRQLALTLLARNDIDRDHAELLPLSMKDAADNLLAGRIDAALFVSSFESPVVTRLIASDGVELLSFPRAEAYTALYPFLSRLTVPAGVGDLARNRPPADVTLLAPMTSLAVRKGLHRGIQYLLLDAAAEIHSGHRLFQRAGRFPAAEADDLPLSDAASQFYKTGRPFLQRYLPFWVAVSLMQLGILLLPVLGAVYPLLRFAPALYGWTVRRRIFRLYGELKLLEGELEKRDPGEGTSDLVAQLDRLEGRANHLHVPLAFTAVLYALRRDIQLVRDRLAGRKDAAPRGGG